MNALRMLHLLKQAEAKFDAEVQRILTTAELDTTAVKHAVKERVTRMKRAANFGYKYPKGEHWTQRSENKAKLRKMIARSAAKRRAR